LEDLEEEVEEVNYKPNPRKKRGGKRVGVKDERLKL
jgi:hypothetical protein